MPQIWKISPGTGAEDWEIFRDNACIGIGWLRGGDLRKFDDVEKLAKAIKKSREDKGKKKWTGSARMALTFCNDFQIGDVLVASKRKESAQSVVGIGVIESEYLPPDDSKNPIPNDESTKRRHVRMVKWVATIEAPISKSNFFATSTLYPLEPRKVKDVQAAYKATHPDSASLHLLIERLFSGCEAVPTPEAQDLGSDIPKRVLVSTYRVLRDTELARTVKRLHDHRCQICRQTIELPDGSRYAEAHHIRPLGKPHIGPDRMENVLCLCPNHHAECDLGLRILSHDTLQTVAGHEVGSQFIEYHNSRIKSRN